MLRRRVEAFTEREFEPADHFQIGPALAASLIAGAVLWLAPRGSPWSTFTFFAPIIMGRTATPFLDLSLPEVWGIHLGLSFLYGIIISLVVSRLHQGRAILVGAISGLVLYLVNWAIVRAVWPAWQNSEFAVLFTHVVFGLIAAAAYRGLLKRRITEMVTPS